MVKGRVLAALLVAPLTLFPVVTIYAFLVQLALRPESAFDEIVFVFGISGVLIAYPVVFVLGIPVHLLLNRLGVSRSSMHALFGSIVGFVGFLYAFVSGSTLALDDEAFSVLSVYAIMFVLAGAVVALSFGLIARTGKIDDT